MIYFILLIVLICIIAFCISYLADTAIFDDGPMRSELDERIRGRRTIMQIIGIISIFCLAGFLTYAKFTEFTLSEEWYFNNDAARNQKLVECKAQPSEISSKDFRCINAANASRDRAKQIADTENTLKNAPVVGSSK